MEKQGAIERHLTPPEKPEPGQKEAQTRTRDQLANDTTKRLIDNTSARFAERAKKN